MSLDDRRPALEGERGPGRDPSLKVQRGLGDFQTPTPLVEAVLKVLERRGVRWSRVLEPTCGQGNFIAGLLNLSFPPQEIVGIEYQATYVRAAQDMVAKQLKAAGETAGSVRIDVVHANLFGVDLAEQVTWSTAGPLLIVGNPPWVTSAQLGVLGSNNMPQRANPKGLQGLDALTGAANYDLGEAIWLKLLRELKHERPTIALLCKIAVARNVLEYTWKERLPVRNATLHQIDAVRWFGARTAACLFTVELGKGSGCYEARVYDSLHASSPETVMGVAEGRLVADVAGFQAARFVEGESPLTWRQGIKHDAASIMELQATADGYVNKLGERVDVESAFVYPLLKGGDLGSRGGEQLGSWLASSSKLPQRGLIVPQMSLQDDTRQLKERAPLLWRYLTGHEQRLARRKSSIYRGRPPFSVFGVGPYTFAPYKVAVSALHKKPLFRPVGPRGGRPVVFDDTTYFVPCGSPQQAALISALLNHPACLRWLGASLFREAKRPVTKRLLQRIDLLNLLSHIIGDSAGQEYLFNYVKQVLRLWSVPKTCRLGDSAGGLSGSSLKKIVMESLWEAEPVR